LSPRASQEAVRDLQKGRSYRGTGGRTSTARRADRGIGGQGGSDKEKAHAWADSHTGGEMSDEWRDEWNEDIPKETPRQQAVWCIQVLFWLIVLVVVAVGGFLLRAYLYYNVGKALSEDPKPVVEDERER